MYTNFSLLQNAKDWLTLHLLRLTTGRGRMWRGHRGFHSLGEKHAFDLASQRVKAQRFRAYPI